MKPWVLALLLFGCDFEEEKIEIVRQDDECYLAITRPHASCERPTTQVHWVDCPEGPVPRGDGDK